MCEASRPMRAAPSAICRLGDGSNWQTMSHLSPAYSGDVCDDIPKAPGNEPPPRRRVAARKWPSVEARASV